MNSRRLAMFYRRLLQAVSTPALLVGMAVGQQASSTPSSATRESLEDAWWTGPSLANSANTLPRRHFLVETYVYDAIGPHSHALGSRTYVEYGVVDKLTVGVTPIFGYNKVDNGTSSAGIRFGDISLLAQYRLTQFHEHKWVPTTAIQVQKTFPTGQYDRLGTRPGDGLGTGAYTTAVALNSQTYFWLPNGGILRTRFDVSESFSSNVDVRDLSVYGTRNGFRGRTQPGNSLLIDASCEYSKGRQWVLAVDAIYAHNQNTTVIGTMNGKTVRLESGSSWEFGFAPAVEYNMSSKLGVIFGVSVMAPGHNTSTTVAPAVAINFVH